jgi:hypothetical protein
VDFFSRNIFVARVYLSLTHFASKNSGEVLAAHHAIRGSDSSYRWNFSPQYLE